MTEKQEVLKDLYKDNINLMDHFLQEIEEEIIEVA